MTTPKTHTCLMHEPGAPACYFRCSCRCDACGTAGRAQDKRNRVRRQLTGQAARVDASMAAAHIRRLLDTGMSRRQIAEQAGVGVTAVARIAAGRPRAHRDTVRAVLQVRPAPSDGWAPTIGVRRRLQALACLGWSTAAVAHRIGVDRRHLQATARASYCVASTARAVEAAYHVLSTRPATGAPQSVLQTRARALRAGWAPPAAWDTAGPHGIDNPAGTPSGIPGRPRTTTRAADIVDAVESGACLADIEARFGATEQSADRALRRAGRPDLANRLRPTRRTAA